jgi:ubiquinone/menaquinone biosynthesis C-methylase UbiE
MPLMSSSFDFLLCRAAFKNFAQPVIALKEMCRVLKPGGRGLIIDLKGNASKSEISRAVDGMGLSTLNRILTKMAFKTMLLKRAYTKPQFEQMLAQAEFAKVEIAENHLGLEIEMTK